MDPVATVFFTSIAVYVADKIAAQAIKDTIYTKLKDSFFPKGSYRNLLKKTILEAIEIFREKNPQDTSNLHFYQHKEIFAHLCAYSLYGNGSEQLVGGFFEKNPHVEIPSKKLLEEFFEIFVSLTKEKPKLKKLYIEEHYKERIFSLSKCNLP